MLTHNMFDLSHFRPGEIRGLSRDEFERLHLDLVDDERVELLRGQIVTIKPPGEQHTRIAAWFHKALLRALGFDERFDVRGHSPFAATPDSVPQPDVQVIEHDARRSRLPRAALLVIEVSVSSRYRDHVIKPPIYAEGDVPEYWIVNAKARTIDVLTRASPMGYQERTTLRIGQMLRPVALPGIEIPVADVPWLPPDDDDPGDDDD